MNNLLDHSTANHTPPCITGIDHVVLRVSDMSAMKAFYCDVLGCTVVREVSRLGLVHLQAGNAMIDLIEKRDSRPWITGPSAATSSLHHLCFSISNPNLESVRDNLRQAGLDVGPIATRFGASGAAAAFYLDDPENNTIELRGEPS